MLKIRARLLVSTLLIATACGSSTPATTGGAGKDGGAGKTGTAGTTGTAGATGAAGTTGEAGATAMAGTTGAAGSDGGAGTTGAAGNDAGTSSDVASQTDGGGTTTTNIKAATGGTVTAAGLTIEIPAGALAVDTDIKVTISKSNGLPGEATLASSVYDLEPNGTTFTKPVKLTINVDAAKLGTKNPVVSYLTGGAWVALSDSVSAAGGKVVATTTHFTLFSVVGTDAAACIAMAKTSCQACCKTTFYKGQNAPLDLAIKACGCKAGSPCETQCAGAGNVCDANPVAASTACQTCLNTVGNANPTSACIAQSQADCVTDVDCKAYITCSAMCTNTPVDASASDASTDAGTDAAACTLGFTNTAPVFMITKTATDVPAPTGGTIVPGIYWLTEQLDYTGPAGATGSTAGTYAETFEITATEWNIDAFTQGQHLAFKSTYTAAGTTFTPTRVCPAGNAIAPFSYSVIGNSIRFTDVGATGAGSSARVLVRQP